MTDKIESIIGFAVKAQKVIYGIDNIESFYKKRYLMIVCHTVSDRTMKRCINAASAVRIPIVKTLSNLLENIVHKTKCKVIALTDRQMSQAIMKYINENYEVITSEVK